MSVLTFYIIWLYIIVQPNKKKTMNTKVTFLLNEEMIKILKEEFASQSSALKKCCTDDNEEAKKIIAKVDDLLSKLDNGGEFVCDSQAIDDVDDVEDFAEELVYLIECSIGIV